MYRELIKSKLNNDETNDIFVIPNIPAVKLGKALMSETRIGSPADVVACHFTGGFLGGSAIIFTNTMLFFGKGSFLLSEVKGSHAKGKEIQVSVNHLGKLTDHILKAGSEGAASILVNLLDDISYSGIGKPEVSAPVYEGFDKGELNWLKLRDEVMKTIDMLQEKFNDGKLSLLEYEEKKTELLSRL